MTVILESITITKDGNRHGELIVQGRRTFRLTMDGSFPFSQSEDRSERTPRSFPDSHRQHFFLACCHHIRIANDGVSVPYRFLDSAKNEWHMDKTAAEWLGNHPDWRAPEDKTADGAVFEYIGFRE